VGAGEAVRHPLGLLAGFAAPYMHPLRSLHEANEAVRAGAREDLLEAALAIAKRHGGLIAAWGMPLALGLAPFTGLAATVGAAAGAAGLVSLAATGVSLAKNVFDASRARSRGALEAQAGQVGDDVLSLGTAAVTYGATKAGGQAIKLVRGRFGPDHPLAGAPLKPLAEPLERAWPDAERVIGALTDAEAAELVLKPVASDKPLEGFSAKMFVQDQVSGRKFLFKPLSQSSAAFEAERFAGNLRRAAGEPATRVYPARVAMPDGRVQQGYIKPLIKLGASPSIEPTAWSAQEQASILADHAWTRFLGDDDAHPTQYAHVGEQGYLLNIDRDHSLATYKADTPLDRLALDNPMMCTSQELLYQAYARGQVDLDFAPLHQAIERIQALPDARVRAELQPYLAKAFARGPFGPYQTPEAFTRAVLARKANLKAEFAAFEAGLKAERARNLGQGGPLPSWKAYGERVKKDAHLSALKGLYDTPVRDWFNTFGRWGMGRQVKAS
jgi:hypothetical protein